MDPRLTDSQTELQERARAAMAGVRDAASSIDEGLSGSRELIAGIGAAGVLAVCLPQSYGGGGGGRTEYALVCEELGAASASVGVAAVAHVVAALLVDAVGSEDAKQELLPALASGSKVATIALDGGGSLLDSPAVSIAAAGAESSATLSGVARAVAGAAEADIFLVPAIDGTDDTTRIFVIERGADGLHVGAERRKLGLNGSGLADVTLDGSAAAPLSAADASAALETAADDLRIGLAALCTGIGRAALEASTAYVTASEAGLDRAQSVQWLLADMATETEAGRLLTWYAASRGSAAELREAAAMARLLASDAAVGASRGAVQILGAGGGDDAARVELLYRDAKAMEVHHGASESQQREVARQLLPDLFEDVTG